MDLTKFAIPSYGQSLSILCQRRIYADMREYEKIAKEIEKTNESITSKKHYALKTDRIEEDMALNRHFKPIIKPLRQTVDSLCVRATKRQSHDNDAVSAPKRERKEEEEEKGEEAIETFEMFRDSV